MIVNPIESRFLEKWEVFFLKLVIGDLKIVAILKFLPHKLKKNRFHQLTNPEPYSFLKFHIVYDIMKSNVINN